MPAADPHAYVTREDMATVMLRMHAEMINAMHVADAHRQAIEDARSKHRNGNRLLVLIVAFMINVTWPALMLHMFHNVAGTAWTAALSSSADILVTTYALRKRY